MTTHSPEITPNVYYTQDEAAAMLRVSRVAIRRLLNSGAAHGIEIGRQWRILGRDLLLLPHIDRTSDNDIVQSMIAMSEPAFKGVWDNDEDSVYDEL